MITVDGAVTIGTFFSGGTLLAMAGFLWRVSAYKSTLDTERKAEREARDKAKEVADRERAAVSKALSHITQKLGNGTPGQVVLVPVCEAMHSKVSAEISTVREVVTLQHGATSETLRVMRASVESASAKADNACEVARDEAAGIKERLSAVESTLVQIASNHRGAQS